MISDIVFIPLWQLMSKKARKLCKFVLTQSSKSQVLKFDMRTQSKTFTIPVIKALNMKNSNVKKKCSWFASQHLKLCSNGQSISKAIYGLLTSPKKWTDEFIFVCFFTLHRKKKQIRLKVFWENLWLANLLFGFIWPLQNMTQPKDYS